MKISEPSPVGVVPVEIRVVNLSHCDLGGRVTELEKKLQKSTKTVTKILPLELKKPFACEVN